MPFPAYRLRHATRLAAAALLCCTSSFSMASTVLNFDSHTGYGDMAPTAEGGFAWTGWFYYDTNQAGLPYNASSPDTRLTTSTNANSITSATPFYFEGAWFSGYATAALHYEFYLAGVKVKTTSAFAPTATPTFVASGYSGPVDTVVVVSLIPNYFVMDDFTYSTAPITPAALPPAAPVNVTATVASPASVTVAWTDASTDETSFAVQQATLTNGVVGPYMTVATVASATTAATGGALSSTVVGLTAGTTYAFQVVAVNAGYPVATAKAASISLAVQAMPNVPVPAAPTGVVAAARSTATAVTLSWTDASTDETAFSVSRSSDGGLSWSTIGSVTRSAAQTSAVGGAAIVFNDTTVAGTVAYQYQVQAVNAGGLSLPSNTVSVAALPAPLAPTGVAVAIASASTATISWTDASTDETSFVVQQATVIGGATGPYTTVATLPRSGTQTSGVGGAALSATASGLIASQAYAWRVVAANALYPVAAAPAASISAVVQAVAGATPPAAPTALAAAVRSTSATVVLSWTDASTNETAFTVSRSSDAGLSWTAIATVTAAAAQVATTGTALSYSDATALAGSAYQYRVTATNGAGSSAASNVVSVAALTAPVAPTAVSALAASATSVTISWTDASTDETSFVVQQAAVTGGVVGPYATVSTVTRSGTQTSGTGGTALSVTATALTTGSAYAWRVVAANALFPITAPGANSTSAVVQATPQVPVPTAPTTLAAAARSSSASVVLSWRDASTNESGFTVSRSSDAGLTWAAIGSVTAATAQVATTGTTLSYSDTTALAGSAYQYRVTASNAGGSSAASNTVSVAAVPSPAAPTGVTAVQASTTSVTVSWVDASTDETSFVVQQAAVTGGVVGPYATVSTVTRSGTQTSGTGGTALSVTATALTTGSAYAWRVVAANALFPITAPGANSTSAVVQATPQVPAPAAPTSLSAAARSTSATVVLSWQDNSTNETAFSISRSSDAGLSWAVIGSVTVTLTQGANTGTTLSYSDTTALAGSAYQYRVTASNAGGASAASNVVSVAALPAPTAPTAVSVTRASSTSATVTWTDASTSETSFDVQRAAVSTSTKVVGAYATVGTVTRSATQTTGTGGSALSFSNTGLSTGTTYAYRVVAVNALFPSASAPASSISAAVQVTP